MTVWQLQIFLFQEVFCIEQGQWRRGIQATCKGGPSLHSLFRFEKEEEEEFQVELLQELVPARLSRFKCSKIVHAPFFKQVVVGCYIRIGVGPMGGGQSRYQVCLPVCMFSFKRTEISNCLFQIMEIVNVVETAKIYALEDTKTNKVRENSPAIA